jgi:hypothetical protein
MARNTIVSRVKNKSRNVVLSLNCDHLIFNHRDTLK